jgi:hypothetical protein
VPEPSPPSLTPFAWVYKRDGRLVPFEADKISRSLFAATETLGRPDAFLARELTDGILHFLAADSDGGVPTTARIADTVIQVVRELGQPALAQVVAEAAARRSEKKSAPAALPSAHTLTAPAPREVLGPSWAELEEWVTEAPGPHTLAWRLSRASLCAYSLRAVFTRDLVAAHQDGLLTLTTLATPLELAGCVLGAPARQSHRDALDEARGLAGEYLALDGPEYALLHTPGEQADMAAFARALHRGLGACGLRGVVNLNCATPPSWADDLAEGPLYAGQQPAPEAGRRAAVAETFLERLLEPGKPAGPRGGQAQGDPPPDRPDSLLRVDWHLGEHDLAPAHQDRLLRLARRALDHPAQAFVFDRPRRPVPLAEGLDRRHPAVLLTVGLNLPRLTEQPGVRTDPARLLSKLGSLARLALSAAVQKREFLRRQHRNRPAFFLDRARLVVAPIGLQAAVEQLRGSLFSPGGPGLAFAHQVVRHLREVLARDGQTYRLATCVDAPAEFVLDDRSGSSFPDPVHAAGLTAWDPQVPAKDQLRVAGVLHGAAEMGTAAVFLSEGAPPTPDQLAEFLRYAWHKTDVVRLRLLRPAAPDRQMLGLW